MPDVERWRQIGVTHWHLIPPHEWAISDSARFSTENMRAERARSAGASRSPQETVAWLDGTLQRLIGQHRHDEAMLRSSGILTEADRLSVTQTRFFMATRGLDVCAMLALRGGRIAHYSAYAMTELECTAHR